MEWEEWLNTANAAVLAQASRALTDVEVAILKGASTGLTYTEIGRQGGYSTSYLERDAGPKLWRLLSKALGVKVSKTNFRTALSRYRSPTAPSPSSQPVPPAAIDLLEAPKPPVFYGRAAELSTLKQWMAGTEAQSPCRLIAILGIGGIGKTAFAATLAQHIKGDFEQVIWRSLRNAPSLKTLLQEIVPFLSGGQVLKPDCRQLLNQLRAARCLVILDNVESILQPDQAGQWRPDYEAYGELLRQAGELEHSSCILLTSREKPVDIARLEGPTQPVRSLSLGGLTTEALAFLEAEGLSGTPEHFQAAISAYGSNPLALKIVATSIRDLFEGKVGDFLACGTILFNGVQRLLDEQFNRLSPVEQGVMYWLAINREWTSVQALQTDLIPTVETSAVLEALEQLCWRSLIEHQGGRYTQQPVVMEYVSHRFIQQIKAELASLDLDLFCRYALFKTTVKDYIGATQSRLFIRPIADYLQHTFTTTAALDHHLRSLLDTIRQQPPGASKYAAGNLLNLCQVLPIDLDGWDCSHLDIWHGNFHNHHLRGVSLTGADLTHSAFTDHFGGVLTVLFSRDGTLIASGETQGNIYIRKVDDGRLVHILQGHQAFIREMSFSPDGRILASSSQDRTIKLWDLQTGLCLKTFTGHQEILTAVAWNPEGTLLASSSFDQTIKLWNPDTGKCLKTFTANASEITYFEWSRDGKRLIACDGGPNAVVWDVHTGEVIQCFEGHTAHVQFVSQSPDGTQMATASLDGSLKIWDVATGRCLQTLAENFPPSSCVVFHPNGTLLASAGIDCTVRLWDRISGQCLKVLTGHKSLVWRVRFSPDGRLLASASDDRTLKLWDMSSGQCMRTWQGHVEVIWSLAVSPRGEIASGEQNGTIRMWDSNVARCEAALTEHSNMIFALAWQPQGDYLASGSHDGTLRIWAAHSYRLIQTITDHQTLVNDVAWHPDGNRIASASLNGTTQVHAIGSGDCLQTFEHSSFVYSVTYHPDGNCLVTGAQDGHIRLWHPDQDVCSAVLKGHRDSVWSLVWHPEGNHLASGSHDGTIRIWQAESCVEIFDSQAGWVWSLAWSPDGTKLVSGHQDGKARIWDIATGRCLIVLAGHSRWVRAVAWMPNGNAIATGSTDGDIRLWDSRSGECLKTLRAKRFYEGTNIFQTTGISQAQRTSLVALGAIDHPPKASMLGG